MRRRRRRRCHAIAIAVVAATAKAVMELVRLARVELQRELRREDLAQLTRALEVRMRLEDVRLHQRDELSALLLVRQVICQQLREFGGIFEDGNGKTRHRR